MEGGGVSVVKVNRACCKTAKVGGMNRLFLEMEKHFVPPWPACLVDYFSYQFTWAEVNEIKTAEGKER